MNALRIVALFALLLGGCASYEERSKALIDADYHAADALIAAAAPHLDAGKPIIIATMVDIDDLERSSTLGRYLSETVSARFTQSHYRMVELKLQNAVYMKNGEGELMLTRRIREIANAHQAQAIVVGTYSRALTTVFVNLKVVRPESNIVLAAEDYAIPITADVCTMLHLDRRACADSY